MKIELKTTPDGVITLKNVLQGVYNSEPQTKLEKMVKCVLMDVVDKIESKAKDLQRKQSLFDTKKKVSLILKYSQAFYLANFLLSLPESENDFEKNQVHQLINQLDQKLC